MKKLLPVFVLVGLFAAEASAQGPSYSMGYVYGQPGTSMRHTIQATHGVNFGIMFPVFTPGLELGAELGFGSYGSDTYDQSYRFENGDAMLAPVMVNNNLFNTGLVLRYTFLEDGAVSPFINAKLGMVRLGTRLTLDDPRSTHTNECPVPLLTETLQSDISFTQGVGAGLRVDMGSIFKGISNQRHFITVGVDYLRGSALEYMSVNAPMGTFNSGESVESITFPFANQAQPEVVHEYHTGYLYRTALEFTQFSISYVARF